jgi:hypothetical protein
VASTPERGSGEGRLRASDADRDRVAAVLRQHCSAGRLTFEELSERLGQVYEARTLDQLFALTNDMPDPEPHPQLGEYLPRLRPTVPARRRALAVDAATYAVISAVLVTVWAVTGGGYFWPMWLIIVWGALLAVHAVSVFRRPGGGSEGA